MEYLERGLYKSMRNQQKQFSVSLAIMISFYYDWEQSKYALMYIHPKVKRRLFSMDDRTFLNDANRQM